MLFIGFTMQPLISLYIFLLFNIFSNKELNSQIIYPRLFLAELVIYLLFLAVLNQSRISIPDTPERNESFNTTKFVSDTPPDRNVNLSISTYSVNNNSITDASITKKSLIQYHVNRHTQTLIDNQEILVIIPPEIQTNNSQDQFNQSNIETNNTQDQLNQPDIQTNNPQDPLNLHEIQTINIMISI